MISRTRHQRPEGTVGPSGPDAHSVVSPVTVLGGPTPPAPSWLRRPVLGRHADRDLRGHLERELGAMAAVLHDVRLSGTSHTLDHLVVAPSGIWLIDVVHLTGRITKRDVGTRLEPANRLMLNGDDRSTLVDELGILRQARHAVAAMKFGVEIQTATCLIDATWPMSARPFQVRNHWITWPRALTDKIRSSGLVPIRTAHDIAAAISSNQSDRVAYRTSSRATTAGFTGVHAAHPDDGGQRDEQPAEHGVSSTV